VPGRAAIDRAPGLGIDGAFDPRQRDPMAARVTVSRARRAVAGMAPVTSRREHRTITLGPRGALRLAVVADTHSQPHPDAARHLRELAPDAILHGGDIGDPRVLEDLATIAPLHAVRGNIDGTAIDVPDVLTLSLEDAQGVLAKVLLTHIAVAGPRLRADAARLAHAEHASIVVCGHSHVPFMGRDRGLVIFNPGSIGPRRFLLPIVFGVIDVARDGIALRHVDCETGATWQPP